MCRDCNRFRCSRCGCQRDTMPKTLGADLADKGNRYLRRPSVVDASSSSTSCPHPQTGVPLGSSNKLATLLIRGVLWGGMSAVFASEIARASVVDGLAFPDLKQLARLGTSGSHKCHIWRDFRKCLKTIAYTEGIAECNCPRESRCCDGSTWRNWDSLPTRIILCNARTLL